MPKYCVDTGDSVEAEIVSSDEMSVSGVNIGVYLSMKLERPIGCKRAKQEWMDNRKLLVHDKHLVVMESLAAANNAIATTMALREKKSHLLGMARLFQ